ncbi:MAG: hypothetical protein VXY83_04075 [Pseudomonadota bacterium]|nr:hypothetical protein [Pseudomonadota bacterium]
MRKVFPVLVGLLIICGGVYYVINPIDQTQVAQKQGQQTGQEAQTSSKKAKEMVDPCKQLPADVAFDQCGFQHVVYAEQDAFLLALDGASFGLWMPDGQFVPVQTNLYFTPQQAVNAYLAKQQLVVKEEDWQSVEKEIRLSKRGYLLALHFKTPEQGTIYISPNGRITGRLK